MTPTRSGTEERVQRETNYDRLSRSLTTVLDPTSPASEAYHTLCANLLYSSAPAARVILVTSPGSAEGKSTVCANLGAALSQVGERVLVMDCNLREPAVHRIFGLDSDPGVVDVLTGEHSLREVYREPLPNLKVLTVGTMPLMPAELLNPRSLSELFAEVRTEFDYVLVDSASAGLVADPIRLAAHADGVLVTFDARRTRKADLKQTIRGLEAVGARICGVVMNNSNTDNRGPR